MKHLKIGLYEILALAIIASATLLRMLLVGLGWPQTNSDEATTGLMGMHIAYNGEHPVFFYGQYYMGSLEAHLAAIFFQLFGASVFTLRLATTLLFALFLVSIYLLASLLYTKKLALVTLILLSLGSWVMLSTQVVALGGYPETLLFGTLSLLLACWLAFSSPVRGQYLSRRRHWLRLLCYTCWGLAAGLGIWSDFLVLPFIAVSGLFLVIFCWRDLLSLAPICLLLGLILGAFPLLTFNLTAPWAHNSLNIALHLHQNGTAELARIERTTGANPLALEVQGTMLVSLPAATGAPPLCLDAELRYLPASPHSLNCTLVHVSWSLGLLALWTIAVYLEIRTLWKLWRYARPARALAAARLALLGSAGLAFLLFLLSPAPAVWPTNDRYLIGLLIATPALIAPLWDGIGPFLPSLSETLLAVLTLIARRGILVLLALVLLTGTISTFLEVPQAQATDQQQYALISDLEQLHITHIYSDYWICDRIAFESREQIICAVLDANLQPSLSYNRYAPYLSIVRTDPRTAYVFLLHSPQEETLTQRLLHTKQSYERFFFEGYVVYRIAET